MADHVNQAPAAATRSKSWRPTIALWTWALLGWWWAFNLDCGKQSLQALLDVGLFKPSKDPLYGRAGDAPSALAALLRTPERLSELTGAPASGLSPDAVCAWAFTDRKDVIVLGKGPSRAAKTVTWLAATLAGEGFLGRYTGGLWSGPCDGETSLRRQTCTKVKDLRLVERVKMPSAPSGTTPILPGQCVVGSLGDSPADDSDRYWIELPRERDVTVPSYTLPAAAFVTVRLVFAGKDFPHLTNAPSEFHSQDAGPYQVVVARAAGSPAGRIRYSLRVTWGRGVGPRCPIVEFDGHACAGGAPSTP
jgi:hypothetical protein